MFCRYVRSIASALLALSFSVAHSFGAEIHLSWNPNPESDIAGYKVHATDLTINTRSTFDVGRQTEATFDAETGRSYAFTVTAYNLAGLASAPSEEVRYNGSPARQLHLSWNRNPETDIAGYKVYARDLTVNAQSIFDVGPQVEASFAPEDGRSYAFTVTAYNVVGLESAPSAEVRYNAPVQSLSVSWAASIYTNVVEYRLSYARLNQTAQQIRVGTKTSTFVSDVIRGETYFLYVEAFDIGGKQIDAWHQITVTIPGEGPMGEAFIPRANLPPQVVLTSPTADSTYDAPAIIELSATASDPDGAIRSVDFYAGTIKVASDTLAPYNVSWTGVAPGSYQVSAVVIDDQGASGRSASALVTVRQVAPATPTTPVSVTATAVSAAIVIEWEAASFAAEYIVERASSATGPFSAVGTTKITQFTDSAVQTGAIYYYRVVAGANDALSAPSAVVSATLSSSAPTAPESLAASVAKWKIMLSWQDRSTDETAFVIERSLDGISFSEIGQVNANVMTFDDTGVTARRTYYYRVGAVNPAGTRYSPVVEATGR